MANQGGKGMGPARKWPPLELRAHHLLCLLGFRGLGYDEKFVANMAAVSEGLAGAPPRLVRTIAGPDVICAACPHCTADGCAKRGPESEAHVQELDRRVLNLLGLAAGALLSWEEVRLRLSAGLGPADLPAVCGQCEWLSLGYCAEGLAQLAAAHSPRGR
jgi:hypothetical protein